MSAKERKTSQARNMSNRCSNLFERASESKTMTITSISSLLILSLVTIIFSATQTSPTSGTIILSWDDTCDSTLNQYLSPFAFAITSVIDDGIYSCPWRERNNILRLLVICFQIVACIGFLLILCWRANQHWWMFLIYFEWLLFVMLFVVFVLDCDSVNTG
eukprot:309595_1